MSGKSQRKLIDLNSREFLTVGFSLTAHGIAVVELRVWKKATAGTAPQIASRPIVLSKHAGSCLGRALLKATKLLEG
jgi:hypothetical protein